MPRLPFRGDRLQPSRDRVAAFWRRAGWRYAARLGRFAAFGPGALAVAGLSNLVTRIPKLDTMPSRQIAVMGPMAKRRKVEKAKEQGDASGYIQLSYASASYNRSLSRSQYLQRLLSSQVDSIIDRWQNLSATGAANGQFYLSNTVSGTQPNRTRLMPLYAFELNSLGRNLMQIDGGASAIRAWPFARLRQVENTNAFSFTGSGLNGSNYAGLVADTVANKAWQRERNMYSTLTANDVYSYAMTDWVEVVVPIWGATTDPSSVDVMVCRFTDDALPPAGTGWDSLDNFINFFPMPDSVNEPEEFERCNKFWASMTDNTNGNFIRRFSFKNAGVRGIKVLKHQKFHFNPTANYENDTAGHQKICRMFLKLNELTSYCGADSSLVTDNTAKIPFDGNVNTWPVTEVQSQNRVHATNSKARLFLIIRGQTATVDAGNVATSAPSFDLMVRRKSSFLA